MAENTVYVNKVSYFGQDLIDLTEDTATSASDVRKGKTAHIASGKKITGLMDPAPEWIASEDGKNWEKAYMNTSISWGTILSNLNYGSGESTFVGYSISSSLSGSSISGFFIATQQQNLGYALTYLDLKNQNEIIPIFATESGTYNLDETKSVDCIKGWNNTEVPLSSNTQYCIFLNINNNDTTKIAAGTQIAFGDYISKPTGTLEITSNGIYDVIAKQYVNVNIENGEEVGQEIELDNNVLIFNDDTQRSENAIFLSYDSAYIENKALKLGNKFNSKIDYGVKIGDSINTLYFNTVHDTNSLDSYLNNLDYPYTGQYGNFQLQYNILLAGDNDTPFIYAGSFDNAKIIFAIDSNLPVFFYSTDDVEISNFLPGSVITGSKGWALKSYQWSTSTKITNIESNFAVIKDNYIAKSEQSYGWSRPRMMNRQEIMDVIKEVLLSVPSEMWLAKDIEQDIHYGFLDLTGAHILFRKPGRYSMDREVDISQTRIDNIDQIRALEQSLASKGYPNTLEEYMDTKMKEICQERNYIPLKRSYEAIAPWGDIQVFFGSMIDLPPYYNLDNTYDTIKFHIAFCADNYIEDNCKVVRYYFEVQKSNNTMTFTSVEGPWGEDVTYTDFWNELYPIIEEEQT